MIGKYHLATIKPNIDKVGNVAFTADDVLFDWTAFEVPRGTCAVKSINIIIAGTNAVASSGGLDMDLFFATTVNGVAPPTLGDTNTAMNVISATAAKPYIIAYQGIDGSVMEDSGDGLVGYNVLGGGVTAEKYDNLIIEGDVNYTGTTAGYQTIWVADVFAIGDTIIAFDADGSGETTIGDVTAVAADLITVDAAPNIIADDDEICNLNPIVIKLGLEY